MVRVSVASRCRWMITLHPAMVPRLLAAFGSQRDRYQSAADLQTFSGIAPVTERSGKSKWVRVRWACPHFLRQTLHEWAAHSIGYCDWGGGCFLLEGGRGGGDFGGVGVVGFVW